MILDMLSGNNKKVPLVFLTGVFVGSSVVTYQFLFLLRGATPNMVPKCEFNN